MLDRLLTALGFVMTCRETHATVFDSGWCRRYMSGSECWVVDTGAWKLTDLECEFTFADWVIGHYIGPMSFIEHYKSVFRIVNRKLTKFVTLIIGSFIHLLAETEKFLCLLKKLGNKWLIFLRRRRWKKW